MAVLLDALATAAADQDREDLARAAHQARARMDQAWFRVAVIGEYKSGKSSLVDALVDAPVSAVDDDVATMVPVEVGHADELVARHWIRDADGGTRSVDLDPSDLDGVAAAATDPAGLLVRVGLPRRLLQDGLVLVDTPGTGGLASAGAAVTASTLADAHAVLFVTDASQELTATELDAIVDATERCGRVVLVETRIDISPHWRTIVETDRAHLAARGLDVPVVPVSSELRRLALATDDATLNDESGFPDLLRCIATELIASAGQIVIDGARSEARRILGHLRAPIDTERLALEAAGSEASEGRGGIDGDPVAAAQADLVRLRERAATWQQVLADGMADLVAAVDADLRSGFREVARNLEAAIDEIDPDDDWDAQVPVIHRRVAETVDANLTLLRTGAETLAGRLAELIDDEEPAPVQSWVDATDAVTDGAGCEVTAALDFGEAEVEGSGRVHHAFRAGYGGAMPVMVVGGMALGVLGLGPLVLPLAGVAGVFAGRRAVGDDRVRQLRQRRQQAKTVLRTHLEEVHFRVGGDHKAALRRVQRSLRDHMATRLRELTKSREQALARARQAVEVDEAGRAQRLAELRREEIRLDVLARNIERAGAS